MKKYFILLLTLLFSSVSLADKVTEQEALQKAQKFFKDKRIISRKNLTRGSNAEQQPNANPEDYYVFNVEDKGGFVIISGDDRTPEVLGYADSGNIDMDNLPPNLKGWLEGYSKQIKALETSDNIRRAESRSATRTSREAIEPLITTKWGQEGPYNLMCPEIDGKHCVTGCVATAMAQVMYYHKWPQDACAVIPAYTTGSRQIEMPALAATTFNWSAMRTKYLMGEQDEGAYAVAKLMLYCAQAVEMNYDLDGSDAFILPQDLIKYFGYGKNAKEISKSQYPTSQWEDVLYKELSEGRPIIYRGFATFGGHQFICDGYDGNGYFHFNWGWEGAGNGYFLLSQFSYGSFTNFIDNQSAIIGIQPDNGDAKITDIYCNNSEDLVKTEYTRFSSVEDFSEISLTTGVRVKDEIEANQEISLNYGLGLYKDTQLLDILNYSSAILNTSSNSVYITTNVTFGKNLEDGVYQLRTIYKLSENEKWNVCVDSYANYVLATISGNSLTLRTINASTGNSRYIVNSVRYSRKLLPNHMIDAIVNITNIGDSNEEIVNYQCKQNGWLNLSGFACGSVEAGKTGDVVFPIFIGADYGKEAVVQISSDLQGNNVVWEEKVIFVEPKDQQLSCSNISIDNFHNGILNDTQYHLSLFVTNEGENVFDDLIECQCLEIISEGDLVFGGNNTYQSVILNPGETKQLDFIVPNLVDGNSYKVYLLYYGKDSKTFECFPQGETFQVAIQETNYNGIHYSYSNISKTASVIGGDYGELESLTIPSSIEIDGKTYPVTEIGVNAFKDCHFNSIGLPEGLKSIGQEAFSRCEFNTINLPEGLISIGNRAFELCSFNSLEFPSTLREIHGSAFIYATGFKELTIPEGVIFIGLQEFFGCRDMEVLRLPSTLKSIDYDLIYGCERIKYVYSAMVDPIIVPENAFALYYDEGRPIPSSAILQVPKGSVEKYQAATGWNVFSRITDKDVYKLIYQVDGAEYKTVYLVEGDPITPEASPEARDTYQFSGWSEIPETMPNHDVIVTGTFERHFNVGHVVNVVNFIMNANATPEDIALYDMNNDNELNIGDIILILKSILNSGGGGTSLTRSRSENSVNLAQYTAAQFILNVADETSVKGFHLVKSMEGSHQIMYSEMGANTYYVVVYSLSNQLMKPENDNILVVETDGGNSTSFAMQDVVVALQNGETERYQGHYSGSTGIHKLENQETPTIIYDLKGNRIEGSHGLKNGLYIINGKKVVVK